MDIDITFLDRELKRVNSDMDNTENIISNLKASIETLNETKEIMTKILYIKKSEMNILIEIVNKGLEYTYPNDDLVFDMKFEEKSNRVVPEFYIGDNKLEKKMMGNGGGVISIIGLIIYITFLKLKNIKIALLDEAESMVDPEATALLFEFLDYFATENDMSILMITQKTLEDYSEIQLTSKIKMLKMD